MPRSEQHHTKPTLRNHDFGGEKNENLSQTFRKGSRSSSSGGKTELTFQIWDVAQKEGMEAMCAAYTQQHPDVSIEV